MIKKKNSRFIKPILTVITVIIVLLSTVLSSFALDNTSKGYYVLSCLYGYMKTSYGFNSTGQNATYGLTEEGKQFIQWCQNKKFKDRYTIDWSIGSVTSSKLSEYSDTLLNYADSITEKDYSIQNDYSETSEDTYYLHIKVPKDAGYALQILTYCYLKDINLVSDSTKTNDVNSYFIDYINGSQIPIVNQKNEIPLGNAVIDYQDIVNLDYGDSTYYYKIHYDIDYETEPSMPSYKLLCDKYLKSDNTYDSNYKTFGQGSWFKDLEDRGFYKTNYGLESYVDSLQWCFVTYNDKLYLAQRDFSQKFLNGQPSYMPMLIDISNIQGILNNYTSSELNTNYDNYSKHITSSCICDENDVEHPDWLKYKKLLVNDTYYDLYICISGVDSNGNPVMGSSNASDQDYITKNTNTDDSDGTNYTDNGQQEKDDAKSGISQFINNSSLKSAMNLCTDIFNNLFNMNSSFKILVIVTMTLGLTAFIIGRRLL